MLIADLSGVQHSFWVVFGTLAVLRSNALSTGQNALRGLLGTVAGIIIGGGLVVAIGTNTTVAWVLLPIAVALASLAPAAFSFAAGPAAFTATLLILFDIISPAGWEIGLVRIEDLAIGSAVSLLVGVLFWPRGASSAFRQALAEAYSDSAHYLRQAVEYGVTRCDATSQPVPEPADEGRRAAAAARRLDDTLRRRFPTVTVDEESIYVRDGRVLTSAGVSAGIDLALALIEEDSGDGLAHEIAKDLVVFMRRRGAQPQLSVPARTPRPHRDPLRILIDEIAADPASNHSLSGIAARAGLSERHLSRLFKAETGMTPTAYVLSVRREAALALVEAGETLGAAARHSGVGSEETLRRILKAGRA
ncbi:FUSC family protein [Kribbella qitaiheensis]|uniref:FUSC family protein n=1 Tax=Kribbella qitaiheensis TaxID=1544730 RepID=UPI0019D53134|nr:FUSC family protein [Kribbella qitaiheensis]